MSGKADTLRRIADALERLAPPPPTPAALADHPAWHWRDDALVPARFAPQPLDLLTGIDRQKAAFAENMRRHAAGAAAHDALLWGARGTGKSALVKATAAALAPEGLLLVESDADDLAHLPTLFARLAETDRRVLLFIDDIGFAAGDPAARRVRSLLEGGADARPPQVRLAVTSNRRAIVERDMAEQSDQLNPRDGVEEQLALADRFGLKLSFQATGQAEWLAMVAAYTAHYELACDEGDALAFARQRGGWSGRIAWHYAIELAGRAGRAL